jgi:hypothetical protein
MTATALADDLRGLAGDRWLAGVIVSGKKVEEVDPPPDEPTDTSRPQMPPLPRLLNSQRPVIGASKENH